MQHFDSSIDFVENIVVYLPSLPYLVLFVRAHLGFLVRSGASALDFGFGVHFVGSLGRGLGGLAKGGGRRLLVL